METAYRDYMANMIMYAVNNLAECFGGTKVTKSFSEIINPPVEDKRTAQEIIDDFKARLNGEQYELI